MQAIGASIQAGLRGAIGFLANKPNARDAFDLSLHGVAVSFLAPLIVLPLHLMLSTLEFTTPDGSNANLMKFDIWYYILRWVTFPIIMIPLAVLIDRKNHVLSFLVGWNWSNVVIEAISILPIFLLASSATGAIGAQIILMVVGVYLMIYRWRIAKSLLSIGGWSATAIVAIDMLSTYVAIVLSGGLGDLPQPPGPPPAS